MTEGDHTCTDSPPKRWCQRVCMMYRELHKSQLCAYTLQWTLLWYFPFRVFSLSYKFCQGLMVIYKMLKHRGQIHWELHKFLCNVVINWLACLTFPWHSQRWVIEHQKVEYQWNPKSILWLTSYMKWHTSWPQTLLTICNFDWQVSHTNVQYDIPTLL